MIKIDKKTAFNIPNLLSLYRLLSFPVILYFILSHQEKIFVVLFIINLATDILDGFIARTFNLQTELGARLDSLADEGTYILAFVGIFVFKSNDFAPHLISLSIFITTYISSIIISLIKFKKPPCLHLYSSKIGGYLQGFFLVLLFAFKFYTAFYYIMIIWGILSFLEQITILLISPQLIPNSKGLYWKLKNK